MAEGANRDAWLGPQHPGLLAAQECLLAGDQIEIWFSILQRKLLQPTYSESVAAPKEAILNFIAYYNQTAKPIQWSYTIEKL